MQYNVNPKEHVYFMVKILFTILIIGVLGIVVGKSGKVAGPVLTVCIIYGGLIGLFFFVQKGILVGFLRGACVRVSSDQFSDIYEIVKAHSQNLGLAKAPPVYIMQAGGVLNAFATKFIGKEYIVILSDVLETAYEQGKDAVSFILGHELGHVKCAHMTKNFLLFPSIIVPFLQGAYSRACEYTCDNIGYTLSPTGAVKGMLILSVGKSLHSKVNVNSYLSDCSQQRGFWVWFAEIVSSHPFFPKRIRQFNEANVKS